MEAMLTLFGEVFNEHDTYDSARPDSEYFERLLSK
jgi:hypothetical protein